MTLNFFDEGYSARYCVVYTQVDICKFIIKKKTTIQRYNCILSYITKNKTYPTVGTVPKSNRKM